MHIDPCIWMCLSSFLYLSLLLYSYMLLFSIFPLPSITKVNKNCNSILLCSVGEQYNQHTCLTEKEDTSNSNTQISHYRWWVEALQMHANNDINRTKENAFMLYIWRYLHFTHVYSNTKGWGQLLFGSSDSDSATIRPIRLVYSVIENFVALLLYVSPGFSLLLVIRARGSRGHSTKQSKCVFRKELPWCK